MNNYTYNKNDNSSIINRQINRQETLHVINHLNKNSAMAFDFIHYKLIHWAKMIIISKNTENLAQKIPPD